MLQMTLLGLAEAETLIAAGRAQAQKMGVPCNLAVVDAAGHLVAHVRMDGAPVPSIEHSINKAFTAALFKTPTVDLKETSEPGGSLFGLNVTLDHRVVVFGGGLPVMVDGAVAGAVGASGGTSEQDQAVAAAMLAGLSKS